VVWGVGVAEAGTKTGCWTKTVAGVRTNAVEVATDVAVGMAVFVAAGASAVWV
jgi:hypothetical protein